MLCCIYQYSKIYGTYRNIRYCLGDLCSRHAINKYEKFNHYHAKLRNVTGRAYGVGKHVFQY